MPKPDLVVLDYVYTPISQYLGRKFGIKNSTLVKQGVGAWIAASIITISNYPPLIDNPILTIIMVFCVLYMVSRLYLLAPNADKSPNINLYILNFDRLITLGFLTVDVITWNPIFYEWIIYTSSVYFCCCPAAPPKKAKEKKLLLAEQAV